jgi:hypothetical protein
MMKNKLNYWIDMALVICLIVVATTGLVLYFAFVSGAPGQGRSITFLGTYKSSWLPWHTYFGLTMIVLMILHLVLHLKWLTIMTLNMFKK